MKKKAKKEEFEEQNNTKLEPNEALEKIAKDELGYVGDGERIFINVAGE